MKPIQVMIDERLLQALDASEEVRSEGRSAVIRRAVAEFLKRRRASRVAEAYRVAYGGGQGLEPAFDGWEDQGQWPEK
jgi:metal-responsive CopG/Arc/MetJ family transcriptional regulator